ncbi:KilA-N domain-containing protein [Kingella oralis]|uniref:KilA-N domain protein n=1 Tax=Kingella oralis ATCC 51147 TaxID=629741 RepID=C4GFQ8_9NEIS|nr:KilA-N domain-containing protein [Kingella oralis]EEP69063.1 KilA-N domain protein [Kingella oralis ATCC 51147]QMT41812.1 KilA-N domain-containing protein [Kingella oralis]DAY00589.1 MAG TPA: KilA protein [Caudoviricetes sp.]
MNVIKSFGDIAVSFRNDGFLNASAIAAHFGKRVPDFLKTEQNQEYISDLAEHLSKTLKIVFDKNQLVIVKKGSPANGGGTWLHPKLAIHFARWLDPRFAVWCDEQIEQILSGSLKLSSQTSADQRTPLRQAVSALVGLRGISYSDAYKMVHQRFGVAAIEEIPADVLPAAVEYVHRLTVGALPDDVLRVIASLLRHLPYQMAYFRATEKAVFSLCPELVFKTHDRFQDGIIQARQLADKLGLDFVPWRDIRLV